MVSRDATLRSGALRSRNGRVAANRDLTNSASVTSPAMHFVIRSGINGVDRGSSRGQFMTILQRVEQFPWSGDGVGSVAGGGGRRRPDRGLGERGGRRRRVVRLAVDRAAR